MPSHRFLKNITDPNAEDVPLILIRLFSEDFPDWSDIPQGDEEPFPSDWEPNTMYFVANTEAITSRKRTYIPWAFQLTLPAQGDGGNGAGLRFDNIDRRIADALKLLPAASDIKVSAETVLDVTPDIVEESFDGFNLNQVQISAVNIEAQMSRPDDTTEPFCSVRYLPQNAPGVYR